MIYKSHLVIYKSSVRFINHECALFKLQFRCDLQMARLSTLRYIKVGNLAIYKIAKFVILRFITGNRKAGNLAIFKSQRHFNVLVINYRATFVTFDK